MRKILEYVAAIIILVIVGVFYWYSRNIVTGYYELLWFQNIAYSSWTTKFFLIIPALVYILAMIIGIMRWRKKRSNV